MARKDHGVHKIDVELIDENDNIVSLGDKIIVILPEIETESGFYLSYKILLCKLTLRLGSGLWIEVLKIIENKNKKNDNQPVYVGQKIKFKRIKYEWYKAGEEYEMENCSR